MGGWSTAVTGNGLSMNFADLVLRSLYWLGPLRNVKVTYDNAALSLQGTQGCTHAIGSQKGVPDQIIVLCSSV